MRFRRTLTEFGPPYVVALLLLPYVIAHGRAWPWQPSTIDLQVYVYAVKDLLAGRDIFATTTPGWNLYFIYPPIAAVLMIPLAFGPYLMWQLLWTAALVWAQQSVLKRCGTPGGWRLGLLGIGVLLAMEPLRTTLGYGQVNTLLMAFVVADLLPDRRPGRMQGVLTGLAAAIKLTPGLFVVFDLLIGKKRAAVSAIASFAVLTLVGAIVLPRQTVQFWAGLAGGDTRTASPIYAGNQSLLGVFYRLGASGALTTLIGLAIAGIVALIGVLVAAYWWREGEHVFAVALVGMCTCLASPLSWTHHYVWVLPMAAAVVLRRGLPTWVRWWGGAWAIWVSLCLPLAVLPYGYDRELSYTVLQQLVANLGPVMGAALVVALGVQMVVRTREQVLAPAAV